MPVAVGSSTNTTVDDLINETRRHLQGSARGLLNKLNGSIADGDPILTATYTLNGATPGSYIAIDDEIMYIWTTNGTTGITAMERGMLGSAAAPHSSGALIEIQPRFPRFFITRALQEEIRSWPNTKLFAVGTIDIPASPNQLAYDLTSIASSFYDVIDVALSPQSSDLTLDWISQRRWYVKRNFPTTSFASGIGIVFDSGVGLTGQTYRVVYSKPFDLSAWSGATDIANTIGIPVSAMDIPAIGAAARLLGTRDILRSDTSAQGQTRNSQEVPPMFMTQAAAALMKLRNERLNEEAIKLFSQYPIKGA